MIKNKYISLSLVFLFFISTTGIPVAIHLCKGMDEVSFQSCGMCQSDADNTSKIKRDKCCDSKILASPNVDQYLASQINKEELKISDMITLQLDIDYAINTSEIKSFNNNNNSPPGDNCVPIFISNRNLLI